MIDKGILYEDQRLTKKQKKKIKPVNQGGGPNYLGKQEEVTVPKKWLSDPDHVVAELAYITPKEKKILIDLDLYGSLNGKPNKGPAGIQSLQGDMGSISASSGGGTGNTTGGGGGNNNNNNNNDDGPTARDLAMGAGGKQKTGTITDAKELSKATGTDFTSGVERDTGLERQRQKNIQTLENLKKTTYEDLDRKLLPPTNPFNIGVNILSGFIGKPGFEKNKDFFVENVAGKYGYGYGLEDYEQYMEDRLSGKVGAYGNEAQGQNALRQPDDRQDTASGILEALLLPELTPTIGPVPITGFNYVKPYSNQVVVAPGREGLASLTGGQGFLSSII